MTSVFTYKANIYHVASIYVFFSQHLLRLVCDETCCVILIIRVWLLNVSHKFRAKITMKLNAPD